MTATTAPTQARPILCPVCRRYLGTTTAPKGSMISVKCTSKTCNRWRNVVV